MPLNIFVCVFHVIHREDFIFLDQLDVRDVRDVREQIRDVVLNLFLSSAKSLYPIHTLEAGKATN